MLPGVGVAASGKGQEVCNDGGWKDLVRADGTAFKNQGDCVSYIAKGGTLGRQDGIIFAIAYSDLNGTQGYQAGTTDLLISKLVDGNRNGVVDAGDRVVMGRYPTDSSATDSAAWQVTSHEVTDGRLLASGFAEAVTTIGGHHWWGHNINDQSDVYLEYWGGASGEPLLGVAPAYFGDFHIPDNDFGTVEMRVEATSPSSPSVAVAHVRDDNAGALDKDFVDVEVHTP